MKRILFFIFIVILFLLACEKTEDIVDFPIKTPELVVNAMFTPGTNFEFQVSKSLSVLDNADLGNLRMPPFIYMKTVLSLIPSHNKMQTNGIIQLKNLSLEKLMLFRLVMRDITRWSLKIYYLPLCQ